MPSPYNSDTPSYSPSLQPSSTQNSEYSETLSIVFSNSPSLGELNIPSIIPS